MKRFLAFAALLVPLLASNATAQWNYGWTISASTTDPFVNSGAATFGVATKYLWFNCGTTVTTGQPGMAAAEFNLVPTGVTVLAATAVNNFLNAGGATNPLLAVGGCPAGPVVALNLLVLDTPGTISFATSAGGFLSTVNCEPAPMAFDIDWVGYSSDGSPVPRSEFPADCSGGGDEPPMAICADVVVEADANCEADASIDDGSFDPDGGPLTFVQTPAAPYPLGDTVVELAVTDDEGNTTTCSATVTVEDNTPPEITCPADIKVETAGNNISRDDPQLEPFFNGASATDNCPDPVITNNAPDPIPLGTRLVTFTATDAGGNTATCSATITVNQIVVDDPPMALCADRTVTAAANCMANADIDDGSFDPDGGAVQLSQDPPGPYGLGDTVVTLSVTDNEGNTETCTATVTVEDVTDPSISCPADVKVGTQGTEVPADDPSLADFFAGATATDNCPDAVVSNDAPTAFPIGTTTVTFTATDGSGNSVTCTADVTVNQVQGDEPPEALCADVAIGADANCEADVSIDNGSFDPDGGAVTLSQDPPAPYGLGDTVVTLSVTDDEGNTTTCTATVSVTDATDPSITCPADIKVGSETGEISRDDPALADFFAGVSASDNCTANPTVTDDAPATFSTGTTTVTFSTMDEAGNSASCTADVTVNLTQGDVPPEAICADVTVPAGSNCEADADIDNGSNDPDGGSVTLSQSPAGPYGLGDTVVTLTVTDDEGNTATCTATVTVEDSTDPSISCPADITIVTENDNVPADDPALADFFNGVSGTDNCPGVSISDDAPAIFPVGSTNVTFTATDGAGNTATCVATVTVDQQVVVPPVIDSFEPTQGSVGATIDLNGNGFTGTTDVTFAGPVPLARVARISADFTVVNDGLIQTLVPSGAITGPIQVVNAAGMATTVADFVVTEGGTLACFGVAKVELKYEVDDDGDTDEDTDSDGSNDADEESGVLWRDWDGSFGGLPQDTGDLAKSRVRVRASVDFGPDFDPTTEIITVEVEDMNGDVISLEMGPFDSDADTDSDSEEFRFEQGGAPKIKARIDLRDCRFEVRASHVADVPLQDVGMTAIRLITSAGTGEEIVQVVESRPGFLRYKPEDSPDCCGPDAPFGLALAGRSQLTWEPPKNVDLRQFHVYGSSEPFLSRQAELIHTTTTLSADVSGRDYPYYLVTSVDFSGFESEPALARGILGQEAGADDGGFALYRVRPNPTEPPARIAFELPTATTVKLSVFDIAGRRVRTIVDGVRPAGKHDASWDGLDEAGRRMAAGVYFYRLEAGDFREIRKLTLMK